MILNAKITSTMLGFEDHGIFTCMIWLEWSGGNSGFGGYVLDGASGLAFLQEILGVIGVEKWENLKGKHIQIEVEKEWGGKVLKIGNILMAPTGNNWLEPERFFKKYE